MDHVSHFIALSHTYSTLVQKGKAHERRREGESDEEEKKDEGGEIRAWGCEEGSSSRVCKQEMRQNKCTCKERRGEDA